MVNTSFALQKAVNPTYLREKVARPDIERLKASLKTLLARVDLDETEAHLRDHLRDFLNDTFYKNKHLVTSKGATDLVIHADLTNKSQAAVLFEVKRPKNTNEMVSPENLNRKAMQELVLYYLRERIENQNRSIKTLIITDIHHWFLFDENEFERHVYHNRKLVEYFQNAKDSEKNTDIIYKTIGKDFLPEIVEKLTFTHFDLRQYTKIAFDNDNANDHKLIPLYKGLSPTHLLRLPFANDSNSLDRGFYNELLHIIGLEETKDGGKKIITRRTEKNRNAGSLLENAIATLETEDIVRRLPNARNYGDSRPEQLFNIGLELVITWMNRMLFLKLLEAQLQSYHDKNPEYRFLNFDKIKDFDELNELFFDALANPPGDRPPYTREKFERVPYLNSSLFEISELESQTVRINSLKDRLTLPIAPGTVLKDPVGKKSTGERRTLEYLFQFLDAYDFSSEGAQEIQEESKTLINASVLGLIFEKINGYRDGSFFTPGFVTMHMCRETIRRAVVQKFNQRHGWNCADFGDLQNHLADKRSKTDIQEANQIVNSLKICDPAVGSGHFLVSALNEIIAIKSELGILADANGQRLRGVTAKVENDELIVTDEDGFFNYKIKNGKAGEENQRIQQTLFEEKRSIIENCLFGVDINPNSVKICRLRLWIELLKNAYYKVQDFGNLKNFRNLALETLPNIDINIKNGNSLIARFNLQEDLAPILKKHKQTVAGYQDMVRKYHHAEDKDEKRELVRLIEQLKANFRTEIAARDPLFIKQNELRGKIYNLQQAGLFEESDDIKTKKAAERTKLESELEKTETKIEEIRANAIFRDAFEWRFEFPEVLDAEGRFLGFDCVVGNPPYGVNFNTASNDFFKSQYQTFAFRGESYGLFIEKAVSLLAVNGNFSFIIPDTLLNLGFTNELRKFILTHTELQQIEALPSAVFNDATVDTILLFFKKSQIFNPRTNVLVRNFGKKLQVSSLEQPEREFTISTESLRKQGVFNIQGDTEDLKIIQRVDSSFDVIETFAEMYSGVKVYEVGKGKPSQTQEIRDAKPYTSKQRISNSWLPFFDGKDIGRYDLLWKQNNWLHYGEWLAAPRNPENFENEKILIRKIVGKTLIATYVPETSYCNTLLFVLKLNKKDAKISYKALLGILNSNFIGWYFRKKFQISADDTFPQIMIRDILQFSIPNVNNELTEKIETQVTQIIESKKTNPAADTSGEEKAIDALVYELFGLTDSEIAIVEGGGL